MATVLNMDIAGLVRRLRKFKYEINKSQSAQVTAFRPADATRLQSYLDTLAQYISWMQQQPLLDLPESAPKDIQLGEPEVLGAVENEACADLIEHFSVLEIELVNSQSARNSNRLIMHDQQRAEALLQRMDLFLKDYISQIQPIDMPESSPMTAHTGPGRTGLNMG